jgi:TPR repeat protein
MSSLITEIQTIMHNADQARQNGNIGLYKKNLLKACDLKHAEAFLQMGLFYFNQGICDSQAIGYFTQASSLGNADASYNLGRHYWRVKQYGLMKTYYEVAIRQGDYDAAHMLALYYKDIGDDKLMNIYAIVGANKGHIQCQKLLNDSTTNTDYYYYRNGIEQDNLGNIDDAITFYKKSIDFGIEKGHTKSTLASIHNLGLLYENQNKITLAIQYYEMGIKENDINCIRRLVKIGNHINDMDMIEKYFAMLVERGDETAIKTLNIYKNITKTNK